MSRGLADRGRTGARAVLCAALLAACGDGGEAGAAASAEGPAASTDTSTMAIARRALGPEVGMAIPFRAHDGDARLVAAAIPIPGYVADRGEPGGTVEPGGYEIVVVEAAPDSQAVHRPGLYTTRLPWLERWYDTIGHPRLDSAAIGRMSGVEDANGDGMPEVWAAQFFRGTKGYAWGVRIYDRATRGLYEGMLGSVWTGEGLDSTAFTFNPAAERNASMRQWILRKGQQMDSAYVDARRRERAGGAPVEFDDPQVPEPR